MCDRDDHIPIAAIAHLPAGASVVRALKTMDQWRRTHRAILMRWNEAPGAGGWGGGERLAYFSIEDDTPGEYLGDTFPCDECDNTGFIEGIGNRDVECHKCAK